jgi:glycerol-3-phosphate acyltransferase PlsY
LKGAAAVAVAKVLLGLSIFANSGHGSQGAAGSAANDVYWWVAAAAFAAILGHIFPVWLRFRGGKGVATGVGVFLMLTPLAVGLAALVFLLAVTLTRYVSLGSILAAITIPLFVLLQHTFLRRVDSLAPIMGAAVAGAGLIVFAHRQNIGRLSRGNESKFK